MKKEISKVIENDHELRFVQIDDDSKVTMESDDPVVQAWLQSIKHQRINEKDIHFVVKAFKRAINSGDAAAYAKSQQKKKVDTSLVRILNEWHQKFFKCSPEWDITVDDMIPTDIKVTAIIKFDSGTYYEGEGSSTKEAKVAAATEAWKDIMAGEYDYTEEDMEENNE